MALGAVVALGGFGAVALNLWPGLTDRPGGGADRTGDRAQAPEAHRQRVELQPESTNPEHETIRVDAQPRTSKLWA